MPEAMRVHRALAQAGLGSRRAAERLVEHSAYLEAQLLQEARDERNPRAQRFAILEVAVEARLAQVEVDHADPVSEPGGAFDPTMAGDSLVWLVLGLSNQSWLALPLPIAMPISA